MFQDEARFGRITIPRRCWCPSDIRAEAPQQIVREYTYAYVSLSPLDGKMDSLILPNMYAGTMTVFLEEISRRYPQNYILMVMDGAPCHRAGTLKVPNNIEILQLPPYSPQLNPAENLWDELREKFFGNYVFRDMEAVEKQLVFGLLSLENDNRKIKKISGWKWIIDATK